MISLQPVGMTWLDLRALISDILVTELQEEERSGSEGGFWRGVLVLAGA